MTKAPTVNTVRRIKAKGVKIGQGMYREVWRTQRGKWVLKIDRCPNAWSGTNREEWKTYLKLKALNNLPEGVRIPEMHMVDGNLLVQYVKGRHPKSSCSPDWHSSECEGRENCYANRFRGWNSSVRDMHNQNVMIGDDGYVYIVDLGFGLD